MFLVGRVIPKDGSIHAGTMQEFVSRHDTREQAKIGWSNAESDRLTYGGNYPLIPFHIYRTK